MYEFTPLAELPIPYRVLAESIFNRADDDRFAVSLFTVEAKESITTTKGRAYKLTNNMVYYGETLESDFIAEYSEIIYNPGHKHLAFFVNGEFYIIHISEDRTHPFAVKQDNKQFNIEQVYKNREHLDQMRQLIEINSEARAKFFSQLPEAIKPFETVKGIDIEDGSDKASVSFITPEGTKGILIISFEPDKTSISDVDFDIELVTPIKEYPLYMLNALSQELSFIAHQAVELWNYELTLVLAPQFDKTKDIEQGTEINQIESK